jgi:hypothetical protein
MTSKAGDNDMKQKLRSEEGREDSENSFSFPPSLSTSFSPFLLSHTETTAVTQCRPHTWFLRDCKSPLLKARELYYFSIFRFQ